MDWTAGRLEDASKAMRAHLGKHMLAGDYPDGGPGVAVCGVETLTQPMLEYLVSDRPATLVMHTIPRPEAKIESAAHQPLGCVKTLILEHLDTDHESDPARSRLYGAWFKESAVEHLQLPMGRSTNPALHRCHRNLVSLSVSFYSTHDVVAGSLLCSVIGRLRSISYVDACRLKALQGSEALTQMALPGCRCPFEALRGLDPPPPNLRSLSLSHFYKKAGDFDWDQAAPMPALTELELRDDGFRLRNAVRFIAQNAPALRVLRVVNSSEYTGAANAELCDALGGEASQLHELHVPGCPIGDADVAPLSKLKNLRVIDLRGTWVTPKGLDVLRRKAPWISSILFTPRTRGAGKKDRRPGPGQDA